VLPVDGVPTICYAESAQAVLAAQFEARQLMHEQVYQQQQVKAVECMVADALFAANHVLRISELASRCDAFVNGLCSIGLIWQLQQQVKAVECMMADALFAANHVLRISELASRCVVLHGAGTLCWLTAMVRAAVFSDTVCGYNHAA
jgi:hypothetical protein